MKTTTFIGWARYAILALLLSSVFTQLHAQFVPAWSQYLRRAPSIVGGELIADTDGTFYSYSAFSDPPYDLTTTRTYGTNMDDGGAIITKFNQAGDIIWSTKIWGLGKVIADETYSNTSFVPNSYLLHNHELFLPNIARGGYPVTDASTPTNYGLARINSNGELVFATYTDVSERSALAIDDSYVYLCRPRNGQTGVATSGGSNDGNIYLEKFDLMGNRVFASYYGWDGYDFPQSLQVVNGKAYIAGQSRSTNVPTTDGSVYNHPDYMNEVLLLEISPSGAVTQASYHDAVGLSPGGLYSVGDVNIETDGTYGYLRYNYRDDMTDDIYTVIKKIELSNFASSDGYETIIPYMYPTEGMPMYAKIVDGQYYCVFVSGVNYFPSLPVIGGEPYHGTAPGAGNDIYFMRLSSTGEQTLGGYLGGYYYESYPRFDVFNGYIYITYQAASGDIAVTDSSAANYLTSQYSVAAVVAPQGYTMFSSYISGPVGVSARPKIIANEGCFITQFHTRGAGLTATLNETNVDIDNSDWDYFLIKYSVNIDGIPTTNTVTPNQQSPCFNGYVELLDGNKIVSPDGVSPQYQWQEAFNVSGPWIDIPYAIDENYQPSANAATKYYRRLALVFQCGEGLDTLSMSNISTIHGSTASAPTVNAGGVIFTCAGSPVQVGGTPTATGGTPLYTYNWDFGDKLSDSTIANPIATVNEPTILTLRVTDQGGCEAIKQAVLKIVTVNAGLDKTSCEGTPVRIGTPGLPASSGVTYSWTPTTGLSCSTCAQPLASPTTTTTYNLSVNVNGVCVLTDEVTVNVVNSPGANFAGPDQVLCAGSSAILGAGLGGSYNYTWSGPYLTSYSGETTTVDLSLVTERIPAINPITYTLTATAGGCVYTDQVVVYVQDSYFASMAGSDAECGPREIGRNSELTPNIGESYSWVKLSGDGTILGPTNQLVTTVSATTSGVTLYEVTSTFMGNTCKDTVSVPSSCGSIGGFSCITLNASSVCREAGTVLSVLSSYEGTVTWSPCDGLSTCVGKSVTLTDNVARTYTATFVSSIDPSFTCSTTISTGYTPPTFNIQRYDVCGGETISLGNAANPNYTYQWTPASTNLSCTNCSNPTYTVPTTGIENFQVKVTDITSGCYSVFATDIHSKTVYANAGPDWRVCNNAVVPLGSPDPSGGTWQYSWSPSAAPWQNGTNQNSPQPEVLVAIDLTFVLTVSNGVCVATDTVDVFVNTGPPAAELAGNDTTLCAPGAPVTIGKPAVNGYTYMWSPATGLSCTDCAQPIANPSSTTTYTVYFSYIGTCSITQSDDVVVTVQPKPTVSLGADLIYCPANGPVAIGANAPSGMTSYAWTPATGIDNAAAQNPNSTALAATTYTLSVTDTYGCSNTDDVVVTPVPGPFAGNDTTVCAGSPIKLGAAGNNPATTWSGVAGLSCSTCAQPNFTPTTGGSYTVTATYTNNGCTQTDDIVITVNSAPSFNLGADITYCPGGAPVNIGDNAPAGMDWYSWSPAIGLSNANIANPTSNTTVTRSYVLTVTSGGCEGRDTVKVIVPVAPKAGFDKTICLDGGVATLGAATNNAATTWSGPAGLSCTTCAQPQFTPTAVGDYTFTASYTTGGCTRTDEVIVHVVQETAPIIPIPNPVCQGSCVQIGITPEGGKTYLWSPITGLSDPTIANPIACVGTENIEYTLTVRNTNTGCSASARVTVGVVPVPAPTVTADPISVCAGQNGTINSTTTGGSGNYGYYWSPAIGLDNIAIADPTAYGTPVGTRSYNLDVTDLTTGCNTTLAGGTQVTVNNCIQLSGMVWNDYNGSVDMGSDEHPTNAGTALYVYLVDPLTGLILDKVTVGTNGMYNFQITDNTSYQLVLSTTDASIGASAPAPNLPVGWANTGENQNGIIDVTPTPSVIRITSTTTSILNQDFGIEQIPNSDSYSFTIPKPVLNTSQILSASFGMSTISGSDPEEGFLGTGSTFQITSLAGMNGNTLWYDQDGDGVQDPGEELTDGEMITNYDPALLKVQFSGANSTEFTFNYTSQDAAGENDPTPATYTVNWALPLPITLVSFSGFMDGSVNILKWITASEVNTSHFEVERSANGVNFEYLDQVDAKGNTSSTQNYSLVDAKPLSGTSYYRLKMVDNDGSYAFSKIVVLTRKSVNQPVLSVYPNPARDVLKVSFKGIANDNATITITDMLGQMIHQQQNVVADNDVVVLSTDNLTVGMYLITVHCNNTTASHKIAIVR
jgi:hypothetical protein